MNSIDRNDICGFKPLMMEYDNFQMPTSSQLPLHVCHKKYKRNGDGIGEERPAENNKVVKAKIVVKTNTNSRTLPKPAASEDSEGTTKQQSTRCIRISTKQPIVETSWSRLKPEVDVMYTKFTQGYAC